MSNNEVKGVVKAVSKKGTGVKVGDTWYNSKAPVFNFDMRNKTISFEVDGERNLISEPKVDESSAPSGGGGYKKKPFVDNTIGMAVGAAVNKAVDLAIYEGEGLNLEYIRNAACDIYDLAEDLKAKAGKGSIRGEVKQQQVSTEDESNPFVS